jgi:transcription antitermination factor NusG
MEAMRKTLENKLNFSVETSSLKKGQQVMVTSGPLVGVKGKITKINGQKKLYIEISQIGYTLVVNLDDATGVE